MSPKVYIVAAIAIITLVTVMTRAIPFILFGKRELPPVMNYLGSVLPPAIMVILVCYCLRNTEWTNMHSVLPELISCAAITVVHLIKKNLYLSIIVGTACYMLLIRIL